MCACHSFRLEHFASRHPVKATLRLAPLGLERGPSRCRDRFPERKEWQVLTLAEADPNFPLDTGQPSHGGRTKQHGAAKKSGVGFGTAAKKDLKLRKRVFTRYSVEEFVTALPSRCRITIDTQFATLVCWRPAQKARLLLPFSCFCGKKSVVALGG